MRHKARSGKEEHLYNPLTIHLLQESTRTGNYELFKEYTQRVLMKKKADESEKSYGIQVS